MQKLQMNLPQDQLELLAPTMFLVKEITDLLPLNPAHLVCFDSHPFWLHSTPSSYNCWKKQQQPVPLHALHVANDFTDCNHMAVCRVETAWPLHSDTKAKYVNFAALTISCLTSFFNLCAWQI